MAEDGWNSRNPEKVALSYSVDSWWRNRSEFIQDFIHAAPNVVTYVTAVARVKSASEAIRSQEACTSDIVTAVDALTRSTNEAVRSQQASTTQLVTAVGELKKHQSGVS
jgi:nuclear transport factor 2 (NTF2) superfamily protein